MTTVVDGDAAGREDRRAVDELGFVAGGRARVRAPSTLANVRIRDLLTTPGSANASRTRHDGWTTLWKDQLRLVWTGCRQPGRQRWQWASARGRRRFASETRPQVEHRAIAPRPWCAWVSSGERSSRWCSSHVSLRWLSRFGWGQREFLAEGVDGVLGVSY
jgi:hypothetical protein